MELATVTVALSPIGRFESQSMDIRIQSNIRSNPWFEYHRPLVELDDTQRPCRPEKPREACTEEPPEDPMPQLRADGNPSPPLAGERYAPWQAGTRGKTWPTKYAAVSDARRPRPQGQKSQPLL